MFITFEILKSISESKPLCSIPIAAIQYIVIANDAQNNHRKDAGNSEAESVLTGTALFNFSSCPSSFSFPTPCTPGNGIFSAPGKSLNWIIILNDEL